jgi:hypothetical protein
MPSQERYSMSKETKTLKAKRSLSGESTPVSTRDGRSSMSTRPRVMKLRDSTSNSDSGSTDHSTLSQDSQ